MRWSITACIMTITLGGVTLAGCSDLRANRPLFPVKEYERLIVGRIDAEYVGTDNCVSRCHRHDRLTADFRRSIHGEQIRPETGLPLVNCESCHGPGSLAIKDLPEDPERNDAVNAKCRTETFIDLKALPPKAQSLICLKCHAESSIPILSHWNASPHALNDVSCLDCHKLHKGPSQKAGREEVADLCYRCHPGVRTEFAMKSHHPVRERKMSCIDCHDVHGSSQDKLLKGTATLETCTRCHMEKQGPFVYGHGDLTESCSACHRPHGSIASPLLRSSMPSLCLRCHTGHPTMLLDSSRTLFSNRCTDCHSAIHGTNIPSPDRDQNGNWRPGRLLQ